MKKPSRKTQQDASILVNTIINKMDNINSLMLGDVNVSFDEVGSYNYFYTKKELAILLEGNLPKYFATISNNIEVLYQFTKKVTDIELLEDAKRVVAVMYPLLEFVADEYTNNPESPLNNIISLIKTVQAKIKLHTEETVGVGDISQLAQVTTMGVIQAIKRNQLKAKKIGNTWFVDSEDALKWLIER